MFSDVEGNNAEGSAKDLHSNLQQANRVQFSVDEIKAGGNKIQGLLKVQLILMR